MKFLGDLKLYFGDFGKEYGRYAILLDTIGWDNPDQGLIIVPKDFLSDGASVPRFLWWFLPPWGDKSTLAAVLHDYICQRLDDKDPIKWLPTRALCDREYYLALRACGVDNLMALLAFFSVRFISIKEGRG